MPTKNKRELRVDELDVEGAQLGREHPERLRELWAEALREPMPLGMPPVGMPTVDEEP